MMSPSIAKDAATPPVVGCSSTEMYGTLALRAAATRAADVFAICISDSMPSCMRAPPEAREHDRRAAMRDARARTGA